MGFLYRSSRAWWPGFPNAPALTDAPVIAGVIPEDRMYDWPDGLLDSETGMPCPEVVPQVARRSGGAQWHDYCTTLTCENPSTSLSPEVTKVIQDARGWRHLPWRP